MKGCWKRGAIVVLAGSLSTSPASAVEISPKSPTACDVITLRVRRSFTEDCLWEVTSRVRRNEREIDVTLDLRGRAGCDQVLTDRTFEIPIGPFPAGRYRLSVRWSDAGTVESQSLTIERARPKRK